MLKKIKKKISKNYIKYQIRRHGKVFKTKKCNLNYLFIPNKNSDKLLVVFSGYGNKGEPARYNYVRTFQDLSINRLYILDDFSYDGSGAYYLGKNNDFFVEDAVQELIIGVANEYNITKENIVTCGSSKGGTSALYFGLKYGYGEIITGAPQTKIAHYLKLTKRFDTLEYILGEVTNEKADQLDNLLFDVVKDFNFSEQPKIKIHIGEGDHHYNDYVMPFINCLRENGLEYELDVKDYEKHNQLGIHFPAFALSNIDTK